SLKTSIKTITYLSDIGCLEIQGASLASEGVSFQSILDDVRLNNALSAIQTTVKPISEIARENGYKCPSRFTERFHNRFNITPREIRKASRE
ncbi:helix-turn-helix transcriptional regulator, partial [Escherichia coli]|nr:helix-turn-helix transcriptional regulator [Escherichia coli]MDF8432989.1 helix-turn-helix transcriptional regulator [Escherichia coli]